MENLFGYISNGTPRFYVRHWGYYLCNPYERGDWKRSRITSPFPKIRVTSAKFLPNRTIIFPLFPWLMRYGRQKNRTIIL